MHDACVELDVLVDVEVVCEGLQVAKDLGVAWVPALILRESLHKPRMVSNDGLAEEVSYKFAALWLHGPIPMGNGPWRLTLGTTPDRCGPAKAAGACRHLCTALTGAEISVRS
jgi:hypothetical protein